MLLWNDWWDTDPPIPEAAAELLREPFERSGRCFQTDVRARSAEEVATLVCSTSSIASFDPAEREELRGRLVGLLDGEYRLPVEVELVWTRLR